MSNTNITPGAGSLGLTGSAPFLVGPGPYANNSPRVLQAGPGTLSMVLPQGNVARVRIHDSASLPECTDDNVLMDCSLSPGQIKGFGSFPLMCGLSVSVITGAVNVQVSAS
jgi:hypothetical protein